MKRILIAGLAALAFAATTSSGSAMPRVPADTLSDSADAIVQVRADMDTVMVATCIAVAAVTTMDGRAVAIAAGNR
ncbi:MAG: hypothetical protein JWR49_3849 [Tardiphaga sp.]|nr:hypothetical protein [Tardiphaga sp.]